MLDTPHSRHDKEMIIIVHMDFDAFFASVEEREHPWMLGSPIVVGSDPKGGEGRGVVSTANYAAREYGIGSALPITQAWKLSEEAKSQGKPVTYFVSGNMSLYGRVSNDIMEIAKTYTTELQVVGIDEAYLRFSAEESFNGVRRQILALQKDIQRTAGITASFGIAENKLLAKIASDKKKPNGITVVTPENVQAFLKDLPIRRIPGIGPKAAATLYKFGVRTVNELQRFGEEELIGIFGKWGSSLYRKSRGEGSNTFVLQGKQKIISIDHTFQSDISGTSELLDMLGKLTEKLILRMEGSGFSSAGQVGITVRFSSFQTKTRQRTLDKAVDNSKALYQGLLPMLLPFLDRRENMHMQSFRLLGVRLGKLNY